MKLNKIKVLAGALALSIAAVSPSALTTVHNVYAAGDTKAEAGWVLKDTKWYYLNKEGHEVKNDWIQYKNQWYYLDSTGTMVTGWTQWKGTWYYLNASNGDMAFSSVTPDGYEVGEDGAWLKDGFGGLKKNEYTGLIIEVKTDQTVKSGDAVSVSVKLKNMGSKTVVFTHGSGSFKTPQALSVKIPGMQPISPKDHLGLATMDYQKSTLKPGEERDFELKIRAIRFNEKFDEYSFYMYNVDNKYIGDISWADLKNTHSDLEAVSAGSYKGQIVLPYAVLEEGAEEVFKDETGFNIGEFTIDVK